MAALIDRELFDHELAEFFPSAARRPATPSRLVAGLFSLQHAYKLSDEAVVARWVDNPYYQHFCGETVRREHDSPDHFLLFLTPATHPIDQFSLTRWRNRIGGEGVEWLLTKTIEAGCSAGAVDDKSFERVSVDTTVMDFKGTVAPVGPRKPHRTISLIRPMRAFMIARARSSWLGAVKRVSSCVRPTQDWPHVSYSRLST